MKRIFILLFCLTPFISLSTTFKVAISKTGNDFGLHAIETSDNGYLIVGYTTGGSAIGEDGLVAKVDQNGNLQWYKMFSNTGNDRFYGCLEMNSSYFLVGNTTSGSAGGQDGWVVKIDLSGNIQWSQKFGGTQDDGILKIIKISSDRVIMSGYVDGLQGEKFANLYMIKMKEDGTVFWEKNYGSANDQTNSARNLIMNSAGNIVLSGYTYCFPVGVGGGLHDGITISADTALGNRIWTRSYGSANDDGFNSIIPTNDGNAICNGYARLDGAVNSKYWVLKINSITGDTIWQKSYYQSTTANNSGAIAQANDNGFILALNETGIRTNLMKIDSVGTVLWVKQFNGSGDEEFNTVLTTYDNHYVAVGQTNSFGSGDYDLFIVKTNPDGTLDSCCTHDGNVLTKISSPIVRLQTQLTASTTYASTYSNTNTNITGTVISNCEMIHFNTAKTDVSCFGNNDGTATATINSGIPSFTYSWSTSPVKTTPNITGLSAGTYTVTINDGIGCTETKTVTITEPAALNTSISKTNILCNGSTLGSATINATGGTAPYSYSWNTVPVQTNTTATGLSAGSYTCTVTDDKGCTKTNTVTITEPSLLASTVTSTNITCNGNNNGSATITPTGGTAPYSYSWSTTPTQTNATATLTTGSYTCTITDANGCTATNSVTITQPNAINASITNVVNTSCNASCNGSANVVPNGGMAPYSYSWNTSPIQINAAAANLCAGTYTVIVSDANACTASTTVTITEPSVLSAANSVKTDVICYGNATGSATVTPNGGTPAYTFSWNTTPIQTTATATNLTAGTYTCTVTDANGCTSTNAVTINQPTALVSTITSTTKVGCNGLCNGTAVVSASGSTPNYTYSWSTTPVQTTTNVTNLCLGTYTVTVTDINGCTTTSVATITQETSLVANVSVSQPSCNASCNGIASVTASGATPGYTYSWNTIPVQTTNTINGLCQGTYTVTVTDLVGCTQTATASVVAPSIINSTITATNAICNGSATGSSTVTPTGGTAPYSYSWSTTPLQTNATATALTLGSYTCTITDANGCTATNSVTITQPNAIVASITNVVNSSCNASCNGTATVVPNGGMAPYSYSWNTATAQTNATATNLCAGTYTVIVSDANACTASTTVTITEPSVLSAANSVKTDVICYGNATGSATVTPNGGTPAYTFSWNTTPIQTTATATNLTAGTYTCTVTDANGCTSTNTITINQPAPVSGSISATANVTCNGLCNGSATVSPTGGTAGYSYYWNTTPVQTTATITGLCPGIYSVVITDVNGCTGTVSTYPITEPPPLSTGTNGSNVSCNGGNNGAASVIINGGTPNYSYLWTTVPTQTTTTAINLSAGSYTCTVTDANGCTSSSSITITQSTAITGNITTSNVKCFNGCDGTATIAGNGGTGNYNYSWNTNPVQTTATATGLCSGSYLVTISDNNGCTSTLSTTIAQPISALSSTITNSMNVSCNGGNNGAATIAANGGTTGYSYVWSTSPVQTGTAATNLSAGTYSVTITDMNGCTTTNTISIIEPTAITIVTNTISLTCENINSASVTVSGGAGAYNYLWNTTPVQTSEALTNVPAGVYTVTITDGSGCTQSHTVTIVNTLVTPTAGFSVTPTTASIYSNPIFTVTDKSSNGNTWYWEFGDGTTSSAQHPSHTYSDTGTYCIKQTVINMPSGCKSEFTKCVEVQSDWTFYIPNAFTPDGDGVNDTYGGQGTGITKYKMLVFDRWGNEIFQSNDIDIWWDGKANKGNEMAQQDVYVYVVYLTDIKNKNHKYIGHFTLVK